MMNAPRQMANTTVGLSRMRGASSCRLNKKAVPWFLEPQKPDARHSTNQAMQSPSRSARTRGRMGQRRARPRVPCVLINPPCRFYPPVQAAWRTSRRILRARSRVIPIVSSGSRIPYCDANAGSPRKFRFHVIFCQRNCALRDSSQRCEAAGPTAEGIAGGRVDWS
jgi:hypothetical protein